MQPRGSKLARAPGRSRRAARTPLRERARALSGGRTFRRPTSSEPARARPAGRGRPRVRAERIRAAARSLRRRPSTSSRPRTTARTGGAALLLARARALRAGPRTSGSSTRSRPLGTRSCALARTERAAEAEALLARVMVAPRPTVDRARDALRGPPEPCSCATVLRSQAKARVLAWSRGFRVPRTASTRQALVIGRAGARDAAERSASTSSRRDVLTTIAMTHAPRLATTRASRTWSESVALALACGRPEAARGVQQPRSSSVRVGELSRAFDRCSRKRPCRRASWATWPSRGSGERITLLRAARRAGAWDECSCSHRRVHSPITPREASTAAGELAPRPRQHPSRTRRPRGGARGRAASARAARRRGAATRQGCRLSPSRCVRLRRRGRVDEARHARTSTSQACGSPETARMVVRSLRVGSVRASATRRTLDRLLARSRRRSSWTDAARAIVRGEYA